jgi:hypothetical protein
MIQVNTHTTGLGKIVIHYAVFSFQKHLSLQRKSALLMRKICLLIPQLLRANINLYVPPVSHFYNHFVIRDNRFHPVGIPTSDTDSASTPISGERAEG